MFKFFLIAAFVATAFAADVPWDACEAGLPGPATFSIPECAGTPEGSQCQVAIGETINLLIGINVPGRVTRLPVVAYVTSELGSFEFDLGYADACNAIAGGCPRVAGLYMVVFPVTLYGLPPGTTGTVRVEINDNINRVIACGAITTTFN